MAVNDPSRGTGPDPTPRTVEALTREVGWVRQEYTARFDAIDKAVELLQAYPTEVDKTVGSLKELVLEMFKSVGAKFQSLDDALKAALTAQKEAVAAQNLANRESSQKSEAGFGAQISGLRDQLDDLKNIRLNSIENRLTTIESNKAGMGEQRNRSGELVAYVIGAVGAAIAAASLLLR